MATQTISNVENNFTGGLKTECTGLNFPENACTEVENTVFHLTGRVATRPGVDFEENFETSDILAGDVAMSKYIWNNVGGDGNTRIFVFQIGHFLHFYLASAATEADPISTQKLAATVNLDSFAFSTTDPIECQYADGNGYLFIFHPNMIPTYCSYDAGTITANPINIEIRDFLGVSDGLGIQVRPSVLTNEHNYNLLNQGWTSPPNWWTESPDTKVILLNTNNSFTVSAGLGALPGQRLNGVNPASGGVFGGNVVSYSGTTMVIYVDIAMPALLSFAHTGWQLAPFNPNKIDAWNVALNTYPSNADIWWRFKDSSDVFDPTTSDNVTLGTGQAPRGHFILDAFNQTRGLLSGVADITDIVTEKRPRTGTWFQGRVWYAGVDDSQQATGDSPYYTWTENIYFSQIITDAVEFGRCYQVNDPTDENFFDILPTDGGVISIQGCGSILKLFPIQNGLLVHAANGIWFITGSQGIGFSANDYTITKISSIQCLGASSFIDVLGFPVFWNEEGIYVVSPSEQGGGLTVTNLCLNTITSFYNNIPSASKKFARGTYDANSFLMYWLYKRSPEADLTDRYKYDGVLIFNTSNKAFYTYSFDITVAPNTQPIIRDIAFINNMEGTTSHPDSVVKYFVSFNNGTTPSFTFAEERDETNWVDFISWDDAGIDYPSYFITGYKLHGNALVKFQPVYIQVYSNSIIPTAYRIQGIWDYANTPNSGKYTTTQLITNGLRGFGITYRRHRIRGRGLALQLKVQSVPGKPFDIIGWSALEAKSGNM